MHCLGSSILHDICLNVENENFSVKCCLLAFNIALGPVVSLELFVSRAYVCMLLLITHIIFIHVRFFLRRRRKLHVSVEVLMFLQSIWLRLFFSSSMNRFIAPFVPSGNT